MSDTAFSPQQPPVQTAVLATVTSIPWATLVPNSPAGSTARMVNVGTQVIYWLQDPVTVVSTSNGNPMQVNGAPEKVTLRAQLPVQVIAAATGSTLVITMGEGR